MNEIAAAKSSPIPNAMPAQTCGACKYGCSVSPNLRDALECRVFPPSVIGFPTPNGQIVTHSTYPRVNRTCGACGQFAPKFGEVN